jgi:hypothetical protein
VTTKTKRVPVAACQLRSGPFELSADDAGAAAAKSPPTARILARSGQAIEHWYWGKLVQDLAGMQQLKDRLPLDYCHDAGEILGYAEGWSRESGDLTCTGTLLTDESERAAEIVRLAKAGVPYEASISFTPIAVEYLDDGQAATVNGALVDGPAAVVRKWRLTGLAVCPRGADPNTKTELSAAAGGEFEVELTEKIMPDNNANETPEQIAARVQSELTARITDYTTRFGQHGQAWALSARPLAECYADHVVQLQQQHAAELAAQKSTGDAALADLQGKLTAAEAKVTDLSARLAAVKVGEEKPLSTTPADSQGVAELSAQEQAALGPNLSKFLAAQRRAKAK